MPHLTFLLEEVQNLPPSLSSPLNHHHRLGCYSSSMTAFLCVMSPCTHWHVQREWEPTRRVLWLQWQRFAFGAEGPDLPLNVCCDRAMQPPVQTGLNSHTMQSTCLSSSDFNFQPLVLSNLLFLKTGVCAFPTQSFPLRDELQSSCNYILECLKLIRRNLSLPMCCQRDFHRGDFECVGSSLRLSAFIQLPRTCRAACL